MTAQRSRHVLQAIRHIALAAKRNGNLSPHLTRQGCFAALPNVDLYSNSPRHGLASLCGVNRPSTSDLPDFEATFWSNGEALPPNTSPVLPTNTRCASDRSTVRGFVSSGKSCQSDVYSLFTASQLSGNAFRIPVGFFSTSTERVVVTQERDGEHGDEEPIIEAVRCKVARLREEQPATSNEPGPERNSSSEAESVNREESGFETIQAPKGWNDLGWTRKEVLNWPNAVSMARLVSGPFLSWMIVQGHLGSACVGLVVAGMSDWLDGFLARKLDIKTLLGSYLDPVADKVLVGSVALSMMYTGLLHPALVGLIVARDGGLMTGTILYRAYSLGWKWNKWREIFRIDSEGAAKVEPLLISKFNTVLQLALVGVALLQPALSIEDVYSLVPILSWSVVATTSMSGIAYAYMFFRDPSNLLAFRRAARVPGRKVSQASAAAHVK